MQQNGRGAPQIVVGNDTNENECNARCVCANVRPKTSSSRMIILIRLLHKVARCRPSACRRRRRRVLLLCCLCCFVHKCSINAISLLAIALVACVPQQLALAGKIHWKNEIDTFNNFWVCVLCFCLFFLLDSMYEKSLSLSVVKFIDINLFLFAASCVFRCVFPLFRC